MTRLDLNQLKAAADNEIERRRKLGAYNQDADAILDLYGLIGDLIDHVADLKNRTASPLRPRKRGK